MTETREKSGANRSIRRRKMYLWSVVLMVAGSLLLPFTGYLAVDTSYAQQAASDDANPRSEYWREVRGGVEGYSAVVGPETGVLIQNGGQNWRQVRNGPVSTYGAWIILALIAALAAYHLLTGGYKMGERTGRKILRWPAADRVLHWFVAITFIILAITGLSILWGRALFIDRIGMSKEAFAAWAAIAKPVHDYLALFFTAGFVVALLKWMHHNIPKAYDLTWLAKGGGYLGGGHPPAGFANAGHKLLYWTLFFAGGAMVVSGLFLLFPNWDTSREGMQLANSIHGITSLICIAFICLHIYLATLGSEGSLEGMVTGYVDEQYAKNHHPLWYDEVKNAQGPVESAGGAPSPAPAAPER